MKLDVVNSGELLHLVNEQILFVNLVKQLEKDFQLSNILWEIPSDVSAEELISSLREKLYYLIMERFSEYLNLLYVIDVPEREFQHIEISDTVEVADQMTFLILKREYQKVWFRNKYK
jgi:hypothetical protein